MTPAEINALSGRELDAAVARALGHTGRLFDVRSPGPEDWGAQLGAYFAHYSTDWNLLPEVLGDGPYQSGRDVDATAHYVAMPCERCGVGTAHIATGSTLLEAACRARLLVHHCGGTNDA